MKGRLLLDEYFMTIANVVMLRASCARRRVGCVLVDAQGRILATGYNGPPTGVPNCTEHPCAGAAAASGEALDLCQAIHAEQNALLQCSDSDRIWACYTTTSPCAHCVKLLANTGCTRIVYGTAYGDVDDSKKFWHRVIRSRATSAGWTFTDDLHLQVQRELGNRLGHPATFANRGRWGSDWREPFGALFGPGSNG
jgi:dCMP deaminase